MYYFGAPFSRFFNLSTRLLRNLTNPVLFFSSAFLKAHGVRKNALYARISQNLQEQSKIYMHVLKKGGGGERKKERKKNKVNS